MSAKPTAPGEGQALTTEPGAGGSGGLGDMPAEEFRAAAHRLVDWVAEYLAHSERYPVLARVKPGEIRTALPGVAPARGEPFEAMLADVERILVPGLTHWNHPGFFAYFAITGSGPGILADLLSSALNQQAVLWRTSPAATELEEVSLGWLRQMLGLPPAFEGVIYDTASVSSLHALAAAREALVPDVRRSGLAGRADLPPLRVYCSEHAHSSIDKAVILLGLGHDSLRRVPSMPTSACGPTRSHGPLPRTALPASCRWPWSPRWERRPPPAWTRCRRSRRSANGNTSGCTWTRRTAAPRPSCPGGSGCSMGARAPTRSW